MTNFLVSNLVGTEDLNGKLEHENNDTNRGAQI